jgi:hypothetical protein
VDQLRPFLKWVETTPVGLFVAHSAHGFNAILMVHLIAVIVFIGMIAIVDLRLMGVTSRESAVTALCRDVLPWTWGAFVISAITGVVVFTGQAAKYSTNFAFQMKFILLVLAGINMLVFQSVIYRGVAKWDSGSAIPVSARLAGAVSLAFWTAIVAFGRWTAYLTM